jgi:hypothetical protein
MKNDILLNGVPPNAGPTKINQGSSARKQKIKQMKNIITKVKLIIKTNRAQG